MAAEMSEKLVERDRLSGIAESEISEEEEDVSFQDINLLRDHGVSAAALGKLKTAGINTIKGLQMTMKRKLAALGFNDAAIAHMLTVSAKLSLSACFLTATEVSDQRKQIFKITTGSKQLDKLFGGGIEAMAITEVFGEFRTGKTQLAHTLCVTAQMPGANGYIGGKVIYIDTEHTFRPDRLRSIADRFNLDQAQVLDNVLYARAYNSEHQYELLNAVSAKLHEEGGIFKLLIFDSIMALFRVDYTGPGEMADRQMKLAQLLSRLQKVSEEYNIAVFMTNQITSDFSSPQINMVQNTKPVGGNILAHASTTRVQLKKGDGATRYAEIFDSPDLEERETIFEITKGGIDDVDNSQCFDTTEASNN